MATRNAGTTSWTLSAVLNHLHNKSPSTSGRVCWPSAKAKKRPELLISVWFNTATNAMSEPTTENKPNWVSPSAL